MDGLQVAVKTEGDQGKAEGATDAGRGDKGETPSPFSNPWLQTLSLVLVAWSSRNLFSGLRIEENAVASVAKRIEGRIEPRRKGDSNKTHTGP